MEYDSESSCEGRCLREPQNPDENPEARERCDRREDDPCPSPPSTEPFKFRSHLGKKSLSAQVMEYYRKYSRDANLDQYFSLPVSNTPQEAITKYYYSVYELSAQVGTSNRQDCIGEEYNLKSYVPRERRRWVRPPLIGQSSNTDASSRYIQPLTDIQTSSPNDLKHAVAPTETILEEEGGRESRERYPEVNERKLSSPTSSVASYKPLEWDSGADVGYYNSLVHKEDEKRLSTIERMALARGCSAALRLDPEGTTESGMQSGKNAAAATVTVMQSGSKSYAPDANSTPLIGNVSGSESEIEITPIVKNHLPGIITGNDIKSEERCISNDAAQPRIVVRPTRLEIHDTPTSSSSAFKMPLAKCLTAERRLVNKRKEAIARPSSSPLKKSISMNIIPALSSKSSLKRSQSDVNLHAKEKRAVFPPIFNSTSSIVTVVNKPATCDKVIQTSPDVCTQESVGVQVSDLEENKSPPSVERDQDPASTAIHSILKRSTRGTYKVKNPRRCDTSPCLAADTEVGEVGGADAKKSQKRRKATSTDVSRNASTSATPQPDETENVSGRANSFEYFPGPTYANTPNERDSHISSDTGRSNSTLPNSSSSINDKLWGDSDSLVRDLERSVNILKSLVDANKCDKQVKKRLIQHVIKRLVTARYTDDKIEHNLEDNVPWNPDDARNKVYRAELLQALANKHSTTESSDEWNLRKKDASMQKSMGTNASDVIKEVALESSNSDKFDRHTDRTEMDGRKARLGLRTDDCQQTSNTTTDHDKSESSECFVPQRTHKNAKVNDIFCFKENCKLPHRESITTNSMPDHNRILLDAVVNNRRTTPVESNNNTDNNTDWRLPTTSSERQFELKKCMSESGDSKLVNYAEMEKRNQLIWITNEISHLCNLKKLLEQPRRLERPKSSPRKSKSNLKSKQAAILKRDQHVDAVHRSMSDLQGDSVNEPWSSHCNLAACEAVGDNMVQRIMKRNSCTQTATGLASAHSKTGGEIVSAGRMRQSATKHVAVGVQMLSREASSTPTAESDVYDAKYANSQKSCAHYQNGTKCRDKSCQTHSSPIVQGTCARCKQSSSEIVRSRKDHQEDVVPAVSQQTQTNYASENSATESAHRRASQIGNVHPKQKEAKNQINASKSKCSCARGTVCSSGSDSKSASSIVKAKRTEYYKRSFTTCPLCFKQKPIDIGNTVCDVCQKNPSCTHNNIIEVEQTWGDACECDNIPVNDADRRIIIGKSRQNVESQSKMRALNYSEQSDTLGKIYANDRAACHNSGTTIETSRECCSSGKVDSNGSCRFECHVKIAEHQLHQAQIYSDSLQDSDANRQHKVQSSLKCNCDEACSCNSNNQAKDIVKARKNYVSKPNYVDDTSINKTERNYKHCRACGATYQSTRKCGCRQTYPKAIAYELSFTKENVSKNEISDIATPKVFKQPSNAIKSDACPCDIIKKNNFNKNLHQTNTLQDYLSRNNPEFVGNAETRRQYLSEICQLRELRKEKRIQLLAMASTSSVIKFAPIRKPTVCIQRKISDEEMKERSRKRYLRLNEVRFKRRQQERQEEARRNKLMAKIFCKRLQQKVLRGQVDLSQSISVISNL